VHAHRAIIGAALEEFAESGPEGLCIEKVAARAGVGKATIYRRWAGKEDLLLDALTALKVPLPRPKGESVRDDLVALLDALRGEAADPRQVRQFALLLGEGDKYPRLLERYLEAVVEPRRGSRSSPCCLGKVTSTRGCSSATSRRSSSPAGRC
jgi:AcrR family transcriptional regulator